MLNYASLVLTIVAGTIVSAAPTNDWNKPCINGECSYDIKGPSAGGKSSGASSGHLRIWGSSNAIADVTPAAGWEILGCSETALKQDIRLVCIDSSKDHCGDLFKTKGAKGKIVRLPEDCGAGPFAVVSRAWIPKDQSVPTEISNRLVRRAGEPTQVHALALSADFGAVDPKSNGEVNVELWGLTAPGFTPGTIKTRDFPSGLNSRIDARGAASPFVTTVVQGFNKFDKDVKANLPRFTKTWSQNLASASMDCPATVTNPLGVKVGASVDVSSTIDVGITVGVVAKGRLIPPKFDEFALYAGMLGSFTAALELTATARGSLDSGIITLWQTPLAGISVAGIFSCGPSFKLNSQALAAIDADGQIKVSLNYNIDSKLFFPKGPSGGGFTPANSPLKIAVAPSIATKGRVEAHIIPTLDFGLRAFGGAAEATVFLDLDAGAATQLTFNAGATMPIAGEDPSKYFNGCLDIGASFSVNAGAKAKFFGLFDPSTRVALFQKNFALYKKCFGTGAKAALFERIAIEASEARAVSLPHGLVEKRGLFCPATGSLSALFNLVDEIVNGASIAAV